MNKIKFFTAIITANLLVLFIRLLNKSGSTALPGLIALKICPDFIKFASKYCNKDIITITGTNGKTTTAGILAHILRENGNKILHNEKGANMLSGIVSELVKNIGICNKKDYFVFESDEAYLKKLYEQLDSNYLLITNIFRDQLDRYGEIDNTFRKIQDAIDKNPNLKLILNANDPIVSMFKSNSDNIYFGFNDIEMMYDSAEVKSPFDAINCPYCGDNMFYTKKYYSHIGKYNCSCGYGIIPLKYNAEAKIFPEYSLINLQYRNKTINFKINLPGLYNAYNALGAICCALELNYPLDVIQTAVKSYKSIFGRSENILINGKKALVQLIKNPVGATEVLRLVTDYKNAKILIILNDNPADGKDVSWIWDANFEVLKNFKEKIFISGTRASDMALRLKYAGIEKKQIHIEKNIQKAMVKSLASISKNETLLILPTYTALLNLEKIIKHNKIKNFVKA